MRTETIAQLRKLSTPKQFSKDEYICQEGQPGEEMYIILKGSVGIFLTSLIARVSTWPICGLPLAVGGPSKKVNCSFPSL